jgi:hypothetical protein
MNSAIAAALPLVATLICRSGCIIIWCRKVEPCGLPLVSETLFRTPRLTRGSTLVSKTGELKMAKRMCALIFGVILLTSPVFAADVDGKWTGTLSTPGGDVPIAFVFKADGDKLTGTMTGMDGMELPIANGKVDGDKISYSVNIDFGGMMLELLYKGVVTPSEIKLDMSVFDMPFQVVVKKEK